METVPKYNEVKHLEMMRHPERWPLPVLPLRHRSHTERDGQFGLLGFMFQDPQLGQADPKVYVGCIYFHQMGIKLEDLPVKEYPDLEAVVAAGWEVN
jgi:hypothetical protein